MTGVAGALGPAGPKGDAGANGRDGNQGQKVRPHPLVPASQDGFVGIFEKLQRAQCSD